MALQDLFATVSTYGASSDDLIRQAQTGDLRAYKELMRRGEMLPPPGRTPPRFGRNARDDGTPAPWRFGRNAQDDGTPVAALDRPSYLDEGRGEQNMLRRREDAPAGLPFMPAIFPETEEAPDYLGTGLMTQQTPLTGDQKITALANGNDAAGAIQSGAGAADSVAGVADGTEALPAPIKSLASAFAAEDEDPYEQQTASVIQDLLGGINPEKNKNMALAQAGFAMAASGSPYFFQGIGKGGEAGLKAFNEAEAQDMEARVRAAQLGTGLSENKERKRSNRAQEGLEGERNIETGRHNVAVETEAQDRLKETRRSNIANEGINRSQVSIQAQNAATAAGNLKVAQDNLAETRRQFDAGHATSEDVKRAQIDASKAQAAAAQALAADRNTSIQIGEDGTVFKVDMTTNKAEPFIGPDGKAIKAAPKGNSASAFKAQYLASAGWSREAIADVLAGKKVITPAQATQIATDRASKESATILDVTQQQSEFQRIYAETYDALTAPAASAPAAQTPSAAPSAAGGEKPPVAGAKKAPDGKWYVPDPNRPGKFLQVQ